MKQHLYSLDFLKFFAALMITNSHFVPLYENVNKSLATFGVHGNALFFLVSGFLLKMGFERHNEIHFVDWYKARVRRLWPSVFIWGIIAAAVWNAPLTVDKLVLASDYWFLQAIAINYFLFYLGMRILPQRFGGGQIDANNFCRFDSHIFYLFLYDEESGRLSISYRLPLHLPL